MARRQGREKLGVEDDHIVITYFGYIYPTKGVETLFKAFKLVVQERPNARLVLVGGTLEWPTHPTYTEELQALPSKLGIEGKITRVGEYAWDSPDASLYLRASDICALPFDGGVSLNNSSFAVAATHGLPVVTTRGDVLEQPIVNERNVLLCSPKSPEELATEPVNDNGTLYGIN